MHLKRLIKNLVFCMKHISFLIVFNTLLLLLIFSFCRGGDRIKEHRVDFEIEKVFFSDDDNSPYFFVGIHEICANSKYIYVSDWKEYSIKIFDHDLNLIKKIGKKGSGPGEFSQIFGDLKCNDSRIYLLTINRLYIFSADGEFEKEIVLRFIPRNVFILKDRFIFRVYSSDKAFFETDFDGNIKNKFFNVGIINTKRCQTSFVTPGAFMSSSGIFFIMDPLKYYIKVYNLEARKVEKSLTRKVDFDGLRCIKSQIKGFGERYFYSGGYSWFLEGESDLFYFYRNSKKEMKIDVYSKDSLKLEWAGKYTGEFFPLCLHPQSGKYLGFCKENSHKLVFTNMKIFRR